MAPLPAPPPPDPKTLLQAASSCAPRLTYPPGSSLQKKLAEAQAELDRLHTALTSSQASLQELQQQGAAAAEARKEGELLGGKLREVRQGAGGACKERGLLGGMLREVRQGAGWGGGGELGAGRGAEQEAQGGDAWEGARWG